MNNYRWRVQGLKASLGEAATEWDKLNERLMAGHAMVDSRFVNGLLRHFGDGSERLCRLEGRGGILGLCILKPARGGIWTSFQPPQAQIGLALLEDPRGIPHLFRQLPGVATRVDFLCQDPLFSPPAPTWPATAQRSPHALTMNISLAGSFDDYWQNRPKKLRETLRTRENRLARAGLEPRLLIHDRPAAMAAAVHRYGLLEYAGWKGRAGSAVSSDNQRGRFYAEMLEAMAGSGQALVYEYWLGDRLAASQLAILRFPMLIALKTTYDENLATYSPGNLLFREMIRDGFARLPGGILEAYTNASPDQLNWATGQRRIEHVCLYRNEAVQQLIATARAARSLVRKLLIGAGGAPVESAGH